MKTARAAAVLTWIYAAGFGLSAIRSLRILWLKDTAHVHGHVRDVRRSVVGTRRAANLRRPTGGFPRVTILAALSAWWPWLGRRSGAVLNLALLPIRPPIFVYRAAFPLALRHRSGRLVAGRRWVSGAAVGPVSGADTVTVVPTKLSWI